MFSSFYHTCSFVLLVLFGMVLIIGTAILGQRNIPPDTISWWLKTKAGRRAKFWIFCFLVMFVFMLAMTVSKTFGQR
jgi:hypothetical protein